jgi:hypothetical protein
MVNCDGRARHGEIDYRLSTVARSQPVLPPTVMTKSSGSSMLGTVTLWGHCFFSDEQILDRYRESGAEALGGLPGNFVVVIDDGDEIVLVSSVHGAFNYFYAVRDGVFFHADTLAGVLEKSRLAWRWNWQALTDVLLVEHAIDNQTIHPDVKRVGPSTVIRFKAGRVTEHRKTWEEVHPNRSAGAEQAVEVANKEVARWIQHPIMVSMSGGFDSRLILSSMLNQGVRPDLLTMGFPDSSDVNISQEVAKRFDLKLQRVEIAPTDYLTHGPRIARLSNGAKTAEHWHTYIYPKKAGLDPRTRLFIGANGEFCRSFLLDKGFAASVADLMPGNAVLRAYWRRRFRSPFRTEELSFMDPEFKELIGPDGRERWANRLVSASPGGLLRGLDQFYLWQRVRNFISNGIKLYSDSCVPVTPFLSHEWTQLVWNLPRMWKQGNEWHRFAIARNCEALMAFPEEKTGRPMAHRAPSLYWARHRKRRVVPYQRFSTWTAHGDLLEFVNSNASLLADVLQPQCLSKICDEHREKKNRAPAMGAFLMMIFWKQHINQIAANARSS